LLPYQFTGRRRPVDAGLMKIPVLGRQSVAMCALVKVCPSPRPYGRD
jgi:hypothetical protein